LPEDFAAPARVLTDLPASFAAVPAALAAFFSPLAAPLAAAFASPAALAADLPWREEAAFLPDVCDDARCWLRFLVAAPFFAAAERSAFACATLLPLSREPDEVEIPPGGTTKPGKPAQARNAAGLDWFVPFFGGIVHTTMGPGAELLRSSETCLDSVFEPRERLTPCEITV
jgi:hypothetical protein